MCAVYDSAADVAGAAGQGAHHLRHVSITAMDRQPATRQPCGVGGGRKARREMDSSQTRAGQPAGQTAVLTRVNWRDERVKIGEWAGRTSGQVDRQAGGWAGRQPGGQVAGRQAGTHGVDCLAVLPFCSETTQYHIIRLL